MNDTKQIEEKVREYCAVAYRTDEDKIGVETVLTDLSPRSILMAGFVSLVQEEYKIPLTLPEVSACGNLGAVVELVSNKVDEKEAKA